ncbi:hypothetical protein FDQ54_23300 [Escherichia coli]|nr:hypothetical protein [Escherichia coli]EFB2633250.1 hypothetical protein [Escherichia coli]EFC6524096.1 hypothetical protein [Escherichia coli]HAG8438893.1 hypothetical protein [Escherichia coli]
MSITALSGLVYVSGVLIWLIKRPNRSTLCLAESNGIEPSSFAQWDGFQDRLSTMLPTLQLCCVLRFVELTAGDQTAPGWTYFSVMLLQESQIVMAGADLRHCLR